MNVFSVFGDVWLPWIYVSILSASAHHTSMWNSLLLSPLPYMIHDTQYIPLCSLYLYSLFIPSRAQVCLRVDGDFQGFHIDFCFYGVGKIFIIIHYNITEWARGRIMRRGKGLCIRITPWSTISVISFVLQGIHKPSRYCKTS